MSGFSQLMLALLLLLIIGLFIATLVLFLRSSGKCGACPPPEPFLPIEIGTVPTSLERFEAKLGEKRLTEPIAWFAVDPPEMTFDPPNVALQYTRLSERETVDAKDVVRHSVDLECGMVRVTPVTALDGVPTNTFRMGIDVPMAIAGPGTGFLEDDVYWNTTSVSFDTCGNAFLGPLEDVDIGPSPTPGFVRFIFTYVFQRTFTCAADTARVNFRTVYFNDEDATKP